MDLLVQNSCIGFGTAQPCAYGQPRATRHQGDRLSSLAACFGFGSSVCYRRSCRSGQLVLGVCEWSLRRAKMFKRQAPTWVAGGQFLCHHSMQLEEDKKFFVIARLPV